jgi:hypothetical protein
VSRNYLKWGTAAVVAAAVIGPMFAQDGPPDRGGEGPRPGEFQGPGGGFPGGPGGGFPGGPGGFGGPGGGRDREILDQYDANGDGWLNREERQGARESLTAERANGGGGGRGRGFGGGMGRGEGEPHKPGIKVSPDDVESFAGEPLYAPHVLRTLFFEFEGDDWEKELEAFHGTDVDVPATLTVDGVSYPLVGVHFRGASSYGGVPTGGKRSLNVSLDLGDKDQRLDGYKTLNLLNAHADDSMMSTVLYSHIARQYIPAPKANFVRVVINGENWGIYVNVQQFDKKFLEENYPSSKGARWKVAGSPGGGGGLVYMGDSPEDYGRYELKTNDESAWESFYELCRVLNETPQDELEAALEPLVDMEELLWFLAIDNALINTDGYWIRASDYSIFLDEQGKFHFVPHDMNESFRVAGGPGFGGGGRRGGGGGTGGGGNFGPPGGGFGPQGGPVGFGPPGGGNGFGPPGGVGPGPEGQPGPGPGPGPSGERPLTREEADQFLDIFFNGGPGGEGRGPQEGGFPPGGSGGRGMGGGGGGGVSLDPLIGLDDASKPLRSRLLSIPSIQKRYLEKVHAIAEDQLDWSKLGPVIGDSRALIEEQVEIDTRKLGSFTGFQSATSNEPPAGGERPAAEEPRRGPFGGSMNLRNFADQRRTYLLQATEPR